MRLSSVVQSAFLALIVPAIISTIWLYFYPALQNCRFPAPRPSTQHNGVAPFRLLALGDPQLEGDTSLPDPDAPLFPSVVGLPRRLWTEPIHVAARIGRRAAKDLVTRDIPRLLYTQRKKLDLLGNDYYLAHIYRSTKSSTRPTHVSVLGDLLGSQWITDAEFERRANRFWHRVFVGARFWTHPTVEQELEHHPEWDFVDTINASQAPALLNVAGNHDIGYAGDIDQSRIDRFERAFGHVNWRIRIPFADPRSNATTHLHLVNLNSMNLDNPSWNQDLHHATHHYLDQVIHDSQARDPKDAVILLTHVPLYKPAGICVDPPFFSYFEPHHGGGIREQNHLSQQSSEKILNGLFQLPGSHGRAGIVLNGHDHEGCDTWHDRPGANQNNWNQTKYSTTAATSENGIREVTVRSMMGAYGGNAGLLSAWFDADAASWKFEYDTCVLGVQHFWWAIHILDLVVLLLAVSSCVLYFLDTIVLKQKVLDQRKKNI